MIESKILKSLFGELSASSCKYCVLRNYVSLPESLEGSDLDLAVLPCELSAVAELVIAVAGSFGGKVIMDYVSSGRMIRLLGCHEGEWWGMAIDLFSKIEYRGVEYISTANLIARAVTHNEIVKVSPDCDADISALTKELLSNGCLRKDYYEKALASYQADSMRSLELMQPFFSTKLIAEFEEFLQKGSKDKKDVLRVVRHLRRDVLSRRWLRQLPMRLKNAYLRYRRVFRPIGSSIAVLGTDGSGKTTMIDAVTPVLQQALHSKVQYEHLRPNWIPGLGVVTGKRDTGDGGVVTDPHAKKPSGFVGSLIRVAYYSIDYVFGYWFKIYPHLVKRPYICLFDRYYYDVLIDPRRMRISLPRWILRVFFFFAPQPRLILCLGGEPEVVYARKPETTLDEVRRQTSELARLCAKNSRAVWIDTGKGLEESRYQILQSTQRSLSSRLTS